MEHEWGRNMVDAGLSDIGFDHPPYPSVGGRMAAQLLLLPDWYLVNLRRPGRKEALLVHVPTDMSVPYDYGMIGFGPAAGHFPYGFPVVPDVPL